MADRKLSPEEQREILEEEVKAYTKIIAEDGYKSEGSQGQPILNPALAARRAALEQIRKLDQKLESEPRTIEAILNSPA